MHSRTTEEIGRMQQWTHLPLFFSWSRIVGFVHFYFGTGRLWLGLAACLTRLVMLVINFAFPPNLNFREITGVRHAQFPRRSQSRCRKEWSARGRGSGEFSSLLLLAFVIDASITLWRRGSAEARRRAVVVGGSIALFIVLAAGWRR